MSNDELLFKEDRPRIIDRYIDYFGASTVVEEAPPWLQRLLDGLNVPRGETR